MLESDGFGFGLCVLFCFVLLGFLFVCFGVWRDGVLYDMVGRQDVAGMTDVGRLV